MNLTFVSMQPFTVKNGTANKRKMFDTNSSLATKPVKTVLKLALTFKFKYFYDYLCLDKIKHFYAMNGIPLLVEVSICISLFTRFCWSLSN